MKRLLLLRHGKSSWKTPVPDDFDRPLTPRGRRAATRMGAEMLARGWLPDHALVSPAARARQTWILLSGSWPGEIPTQMPAALYLAAPRLLGEIIAAMPEAVGRLLIVAHNPGLQKLALALSGPQSDPRALATLRQGFPTASLAVCEIDGAWCDAAEGPARLTHCLRVKELPSKPSFSPGFL